MIKFRLLISLLLIFLFYSGDVQSATPLQLKEKNNTTIEVKYRFKDKQYQFKAIKKGISYSFNPKGESVLNIATLDWPPYVGHNLCNLGWSLQFAVAVLTAMNYQVNVSFYPWVRAVMMVESGQMEILYPEYFIEDSAPSDIYPNIKRRELLVQSNEIIGGRISLFKLKDSEFSFDGNLNAISGKSIGVVRGYQNTPEFDAMMDKGLIRVIEAVDDAQLLKILLGKRADLIIGDPQVFQYAMNSSATHSYERQSLHDIIEEVSPALKYNHLYFAVSTKQENWKPLLEKINLTLIEFEASGEMSRIYQQGGTCASK